MKDTDQSHLYKKILTEIKRAIDENGVSQKKIGEALLIKQSAVSSLLNGHSKLSVPQLVSLCDLLGLSAHVLFFRALHASIDPQKQPDWVSGIVYKSWLHLLIYVTATRPIAIKDLINSQIDRASAEKALDDLVAAGLVKKVGEKYKQSQVAGVMAGDKAMQTLCYKDLISKSMEAWADARKQGFEEYFKSRFNMMHLDRFTDAQILEIESLLWKAFNKMKEFQMANTSKGYEGKADMKVWCLHFMMTTPLELGKA